ncbi:hypothetical protein FACS1894106_3430 [Spirochaetia bacterium]|nr:hypothetical protein FACS1894106_3430 [Spirochaetia bacterium]
MNNNLTIEKILQDIRTEPYILLLGQQFDIEDERNKKILDLPWSSVFTSQKSEKMESVFNNNFRRIRSVVDESSLQVDLLDKKNLKIIHLLGIDPTLQNFSNTLGRTERVKAEEMLNNIPRALEHMGYLVVIGYSPDDIFPTKSSFFDLLVRMRNNSVIIFNDLNKLSKKEILDETDNKEVNFFENFDWDHFTSLLDEGKNLDYQQESYISTSDNNNFHIYIKGKIYPVNRKEWLDVTRFADILNKEDVSGKEIPWHLYSNYFSLFLKDSAYRPQWFGFAQGFNLKRVFEKNLLDEVNDGLKNPGGSRNKPLCLCGQTCSGKSIAVGNLAYKIFQQGNFPVIFINNKNIDFSYDSISTGNDKKNGSPQFKALDNLLMNLEAKGSGSTLIVWDLSAASRREREKCLLLSKSLINRGRNFFLVFTSYELFGEENGNELSYKIIKATPILQNEENKAFFEILKRKAGLSDEEIVLFENKMQGNEITSQNIMASLYYLFDDMRPTLQNGVQSEATRIIKGVLENKEYQTVLEEKTAMEIALEKYTNSKMKEFTERAKSGKSDDLQNAIDNLLKTVALCGKYDLRIPSSLAYRILKNLDYSSISSVANIPFFIYENTEDGYDYTFGIRTKLEAEMLLRYYELSQEKQIEIISNMIREVKISDFFGKNSEVKMVSELLFKIGPNAIQNQHFHVYYPEIIAALKDFREKYNGDIHLTLTEITYMREYANDRYKRCQKTNEDIYNYKKQLNNAIEISKFEISKHREKFSPTIDNINIEIANNLIRLCDFSDDIKECQEAKGRSSDVISHNPDNAHAYTAWLQATLLEYKFSENKGADIAELLAESCDFIDRVRNEHPNISSDQNFFKHARILLGHASQYKIDDYFDELLERNSSAGIVLKIRQILKENNIDIYDGKGEILTQEQIAICDNICIDWFKNAKYLPITGYDFKCQILYLRLKWIIYNKEPIFSHSYSEERYTRIIEKGWNEMLSICEHFKSIFYDTNMYNYNSCHTMLYVLSLCYAQTDNFKKCIEVIKTIADETEIIFYENRLSTQYILCDAIGKPLEFEGNFVKETKPDDVKGYIKIKKIEKDYNGRPGIYYHRRYITKTTDRGEGQYYNDFQLGLGFMGLAVYRGLPTNGGKNA